MTALPSAVLEVYFTASSRLSRMPMVLASCATSAQHAYLPSSGSDLSQAFAAIGLEQLYGISRELATSSYTAYMLASAAGMVVGGFVGAGSGNHDRNIAIAFAIAPPQQKPTAPTLPPRLLLASSSSMATAAEVELARSSFPMASRAASSPGAASPRRRSCSPRRSSTWA